MLIDFVQWTCALNPDEIWILVSSFLLADGCRYALVQWAVCLWDTAKEGLGSLQTSANQQTHYCPSVCVILTGYNEQENIEANLHSLWGSYPKLEIIMVDDGSTDQTFTLARRFIQGRLGIRLLGKPRRGGKSSSFNFALQYTSAEIVVNMDTDTEIAADAIWRIVTPFRDPRVGVVSGCVLVRNSYTNLLTWLQALEYLLGIFIGRMVSHRLNVLSIASGALAAFRRTALLRVGGWDPGPGEDGDITIRIRKAGYLAAFAPHAQCMTSVPTNLWWLFKQRQRWNRSVIRNRCRKHIDIMCFWKKHFNLSNMLMLLDTWIFHLGILYVFWLTVLWFAVNAGFRNWRFIVLGYLLSITFFGIQILVVLSYSTNRWRDIRITLVFPFMPAYYLFLKTARVIAFTDELLFRPSFKDTFCPFRVREATWRW